MPLPDFGTVDEAVAPKLPDFGSPPPQPKLPDFGSPVPSRDKTPAAPMDLDKLNAAADMQQRAQEYTQSLKSGDFARSLLTEVPGDIANAAGSLLEPIRPFLNKAVNALVPYASEIPDSESLFLPPISDEKRGFGPGLYRLAEGLTTKENLALMPLLPESDMVKLAFQLPAAAGAVQGAAQIGQGDVGEGAANVLGQGLFAYLLGRGEKAPMAPEQRNPMEMYRQFVQSQPEFVPQQPRVQQPFTLGLDKSKELIAKMEQIQRESTQSGNFVGGMAKIDELKRQAYGSVDPVLSAKPANVSGQETLPLQGLTLGLDRVLPKAEPPPQVERPLVVANPPAAPPVAATAPTLPVFEKPVEQSGDLTNLGHELKGLAQGILYARAKTKEPVDPALIEAVQEGGNQIWTEANQPGADLNELHQRVADLKGQLSGRIPFFGESKETGPSEKVGELKPPTLTSATEEGPVYPLGRSEATGTLVDKMGRPVTGQSRRLATPEEVAQGPESVAKMAPDESQLPIYKRFDVRTEEGRRAIALRSPKELLGDFGIDPGIARWKGAQARNQGPQAYTRFEKLSTEQLYDKWDEVKRVYESRNADWKKERVELHPDKGGDAAAFAEASARHDADEAIFKELQRHFDARGVETGFDRAEYQRSKMQKKDQQIEDRFRTKQLEDGGKEAPTERVDISSLPTHLQKIYREAKSKPSEFQAVDVSSLTSAERRLLAEKGLSFSENRERKVQATYPAKERQADLRFAVENKTKETPISLRDTLPSRREARQFDALGLAQPKVTALDVVDRMAGSKEFTSSGQALAQFLRDNFAHVLRLSEVSPEKASARGRAVYQPGPHAIGLAVGTGRGLEFKALEEATHAAVFHQLDNPVTESHKAARAELERLMGVAKQHLGEADTFRLSDQAQKAYGPPQSGLAYRFNDIHEFAAGLISDDELRDFLSTIRDPKEGNIFQRAYQKVLDLLGIDKGSVYDKALGELIKLGQDKESWLEAALTNERSPIESPVFIRAKGVMDQLTAPLEKEAPAAGVATVRDKETRERLQARYNAIRGWTAPQHTGASEDVANRLINYASARFAAPEVAKSMATDVLGSHWQDAMFDRTLGALLVEDRLRAVEKSFRDRAAAESDPFKRVELETKADSVTTLMAGPMGARIRAAMKDPEYQAAVERHKQIIQPFAQEMHEKLGGKLAGAGPETDAFVNLIAMFGEDGAEATQNMIFGSRKGELSNPRRRGSVFNKETFGTAPGYETSYRKIAERMVRGNYEQVALRDYYKALVDEDLAVVQKAGTPPTTSKGEKLSSVEIGQNRASWWTPNERLYMRENLYPEFMNAVQTDQRFQRTTIRFLLDAITEAQVQGPVDFAAHGGNMVAVLASSPGSKSWLGDVLRNGTPLGFADAMLRIGVEGFKAMKDSPEYQKMWADITKIGAGRDQLHRKGLLEKGIEALGVPEKAAKFMTPNSLSHIALKFIDKGGRIAANKMFDNLVERGLVKDSELDRREFINRLGQYNSRLMGKVESIARELSFSSFIVAGKNMNRQALRSLTLSPGVRAIDGQARVKLHVQQAISAALLLGVLPPIVNAYTVKNWKGRPGTRLGEIDTGKDDEQGRPIKFDLLKLFLKRRALRNIGFEAAVRAKEQGLSPKDRNNEIIKDIFAGYIHPWMGPSMRFASTALTGRDNLGTGYLQSKNPHDFGANLLAAAVNMNPTVGQLFKDVEEGAPKGTAAKWSLYGVAGFNRGRLPAWNQRQKEEVEKLYPGRQWEQLNAKEKRNVELVVNSAMEEKPKSELGRLNAGEKAYWSQEQRTQDLKASLPPAQQKWLKDNKLNMPGFGSEVTLGKVRLPSTPQEKEVLAKQMGQAYQKALGDLMTSDTFQGRDQKGKQDALERKLMWERKKVMRGFKRGEAN
jgi:hypothetical protein